MKEKIIQEISKILKIRAKILKNLALEGYRKLAFGNITDSLKLMFSDNLSELDFNTLNLWNISEIKKPKDGSLEIKFFDRLKALEKLENINTTEENKLSLFYNTLMKPNNSENIPEQED